MVTTRLRKERVLTVRIDDELSAGMARVHRRHGTPVSEQVRRALRQWLVAHGALTTGRQRGVTRRTP
jgi:antitoxin component of RelBE/YafQ-DinJ toxin-antitoxin module